MLKLVWGFCFGSNTHTHTHTCTKEYVGLPRGHPESYHSFMWKHLFSKIDILPKNAHMLNGNADDLELECRNYEKMILDAGGVELFLAGIGSGRIPTL